MSLTYQHTGQFMTCSTCHSCNRTKRSGDYQPPPPAEILEGEPEYGVDHIVRHREIHKHKNKPADIEYLVAWRGGLPEEYTWEPAIHVKHAAQVVRTYWDKARTRWQV
jgi:mono/diheme cytochrome c family protein